MTKCLGVVMDRIDCITVQKDSTLAMLLEAQARHWSIHYMTLDDLFVDSGTPYAHSHTLIVQDNDKHWFDLSKPTTLDLTTLDVILMRKDPPFNVEYIYATYILELAERAGVLVVNKAQSLRDANEKMFTQWFTTCIPPTVISRNTGVLKTFIKQQQDTVLKPLSAMGGRSIFRVQAGDHNTNVTIETLTQLGSQYIMAQRYIPDISEGDKRILLIDGKPLDYALARIPPDDDPRGNLAVGAKGVGVPLSERDRFICDQVGPVCRDKGLLFVGLDVIGDYLTEINVTSPTCIRELDRLYPKMAITERLFDAIQVRLDQHQR